MGTEPWQTRGFGLYVHWPFCEAKCPYCDFNSHVVAQIDQDIWADALVRELHRMGDIVPGRVLGSVFFGGGTPSLMAPSTVERVLRASAEIWPWANDIEITLEANPRSVEADKFAGFAAAGVNRVSLGVQALHDDDLKRLGRLHDAGEAKTALATARRYFDRVSFDLIYGRQGQTLEAWQTELSQAVDLAADHLSLYQLTIEPGTAFWDRAQRGGLRGLPDEDLAADLYEATQAICTDAGFETYEVSNHARDGAVSRHNLLYWRSGDWVGVGPGAHGRLTYRGDRWRYEAHSQPGRWLQAVNEANGDSVVAKLSPEDIENERIMMGLRLSEGLEIVTSEADKSGFAMTINELCDMGMLWQSAGRIGTTQSGRLVLNAVIEKLLV